MSEPSSSQSPPVVWRPTEAFASTSRLSDYMRWLDRERGLRFVDYDDLWRWSIDDTRAFWKSIWDYFEVQSTGVPTVIHDDTPMPQTAWFPGTRLNYAEHIFRMASPDRPAIVFRSERHPTTEISWSTLSEQTACMAAYLRASGVRPGDRVAAFLPNIPEATIAFLATCSLGAVWSSCSPDFGVGSVVDRFEQIRPRVLFAVDGYTYGGKRHDRRDEVAALKKRIPGVERVVVIPYLEPDGHADFVSGGCTWQAALAAGRQTLPEARPELAFERMPFAHPIWVLYSSGTTGAPKAITHSHGGVLLEHLKYLAFHNDVREGDRFFWFSTTGWMMWNFVQASLLVGASVVLYDGSPGYPDLQALWSLAEEADIHHFGTSAPFIMACLKEGLRPAERFDLKALRSVSSTGAPLPPEAFAWVEEQVGGVWICSMSGGTDVCTAFVGGCPTEPVYLGEIQRRALGCALFAFDESGSPVEDEVGEMVITRPMPSMPVYFWNDEDRTRYRESYFEQYPGVWRHGDWVRVTPRGTLVIYGRSDATLNRQGVRIGTAEIYRALHQVPEVKDALIVNLELDGGRHFMPLFVVPSEGTTLAADVRDRIRTVLRTTYSPRHVPDEIVVIAEVPYTISGKKLEAPVKKILLGMEVRRAANPDAMRNPDALDFFVAFRARVQEIADERD